MVHYTVLVPVRDAADTLGHLLAQLAGVLDRLILPYEIICIEDASAEPAAGRLEILLKEHPYLRVLRFDQPRGTSAALSAGIAASRGELVIGICPDTRIAADYIPHLISRLSRWDLVVAQPQRTLAQTLRGGLESLPRMLSVDRRRRAAEDLFFAARREALVGLALARGAYRVLPELVARRGLRVCRLTIAAGLSPRGDRLRAGLFKRLAAGWLGRRFEPHLARELVGGHATQPSTTPTADEPRRVHFARPAASMPVEQKHAK